MKKKASFSHMTWLQAVKHSPGPDTIRDSALLSLKGLCMGSADVIPGVSGGTIALITGIYEDLLAAIKSINTTALKKALSGDIKGAMALIHIRFLLFLFLGIGTAIISLARLMNYLINNQPVYTWSLFFGLIVASILIVGKKVSPWNMGASAAFIGGTVAAWMIVGLIPVSTPEDLWFIFLAGFIAICAMLLPGLSGAFILLIIGKYEFLTATLKNPFLPANAMVIIVYCAGTAAGILCFSRFLKWLLDRWHNATMAFLTGLMAGSLRKIWPWKETLESIIIRGKPHILREQNILPPDFGSPFLLALTLAGVGVIVVLVLDRMSGPAGESNNRI
jgi:putative membrane protein